jgi:hypothetical protein
MAAVLVTWTAVALEQLTRGLIGAAAGIPFRGVRLAVEPPWLARADVGAAPALSPLGWAAVILGGSLAVVALGLAVHYGTGLFRAGGITRALALEGAVLGLLWLPTTLAVAALPGGRGPAAELYARLGEPQAGRWGALALALLLLALAASLAARRAVAVGRAWMRADAPGFRRRLVRVVAGYPIAASLGGLLVAAGWASPGWAVTWAVVILLTLRLRTS